MSIQIKSFSLAPHTTAGVFASTGISVADYTIYVYSVYFLTIVNTSTDTVGYPLFNPIPYTGSSGSEIYVYNTDPGQTTTVIVMFTSREPSAESPISASTTFTY